MQYIVTFLLVPLMVLYFWLRVISFCKHKDDIFWMEVTVIQKLLESYTWMIVLAVLVSTLTWLDMICYIIFTGLKWGN